MQRDIVEGGHPESSPMPRRRRCCLTVACIFAVGFSVVDGFRQDQSMQSGTHRPSASEPPSAATASGADVRIRLNAHAFLAEQIRHVPLEYCRAAAVASAIGDAHLPGNFFLALAYTRSLYGALLRTSGGRPYAARGPLLWSRADFARYAVAGHHDRARPLDSFLALDRAVTAAGGVDLSAGVFDAARTVGEDGRQAQAVADTYATLATSPSNQGEAQCSEKSER